MRWLKRSAIVFLVVCGLAGGAFFWRVPLLRGAARAWIVNEPLTKADVIVVLGGGPETRPFAAARLFHQGMAPKILLMNPRHPPSVALGLVPAEADLSRNILLKKGVPAKAICVTSELVTNSFDESIAVRNWVKKNGAKSVIIPTDVFHTRRVRWLYGKEDPGLRVEIEAVPVLDYSATDWWQHTQGVIAFQNEVLKYAYYRVKY